MTYIIAEVGSNHLGNLNLAYEHIKVAAEKGANAVKFQYFLAHTDIANRPSGPDSVEYDKYINPSDYKMLKQLEMPLSWLEKLNNCAKHNKIDLLFSASDTSCLEPISKFSNKIKIASCDIDNILLLKAIKGLFKEIILSTGSADYLVIKKAKSFLQNGNNILTILYCVSDYPMKLNKYDLNAIPSLKKYFGPNIGYSDHALNWQASIMAIMQGATVLERHFIIDKKIDSPDAIVSSDPDELGQIINFSKNFNYKHQGKIDDIGSVFKLDRVKSELRRSPVANKNLKKGHQVKIDDVVYLRPAIGMDPFKFYEDFIGKTILRDISSGNYFSESDFN